LARCTGCGRAREALARRAPGLLCASHAWWAATEWRATFGRIDGLARGGQLFFGSRELWVVLFFALTVAAFAVSLWLTYRSAPAKQESEMAVTRV
jgi:hypothetical protein